MSEFFSTLPEVFSALWSYLGDNRPSPWFGVAVIIGNFVIFGGLCFAATRLRETHGWVASVVGMMGATLAAWWAFGVLPSAWIYFADGQRALMEGTVIPSTIGFGENYVIASNFYVVFRDLVTVTIYGIALVTFTVAALWIQKRYPKALAEGEEPRPQSGGYK